MSSTSTFVKKIKSDLSNIEKSGLKRKLKIIEDKKAISFASNDYLGLSKHPKIINAAVEATKKFGTGSGASRLISGNSTYYEKLETEIAKFKNSESSLVFSSGYLANIGTISTLADRNSEIFVDRLCHASIVDSCILSRAKIKRYDHNDCSHLKNLLERSKSSDKLIITEGLFSMDGDIAPLKDIGELAKQYAAVFIVDDAHGTGVLGKKGKGAVDFCNAEGSTDVQIGTLSKALGAVGGFVACSKLIKEYLINKARPFIFTTALPSGVIASATEALRIIQNDSGLQKKLESNWSYLRKKITEMGFKTTSRIGPIVPILIGDENLAVEFSRRLLENGFFVPAIRTPAVEKGKARLRVTISSTHSEEEIDIFCESLFEFGKELAIVG